MFWKWNISGPSIYSEYWNISGLPVFPENVIFTFCRKCQCKAGSFQQSRNSKKKKKTKLAIFGKIKAENTVFRPPKDHKNLSKKLFLCSHHMGIKINMMSNVFVTNHIYPHIFNTVHENWTILNKFCAPVL